MGFGSLRREVNVEDSFSHSCHELHSIADAKDWNSAPACRVEDRLVKGELFGRYKIERDVAGQCFVAREIVAARDE